MGSIKDRNEKKGGGRQKWYRLNRKAEDIKKRWQEYKKEMYKRDLHDPDNHNGVITHLEPDMLECEVSL